MRKKRRLCGNCAGLRNRVNKQIFDHQAPPKKKTWRKFWINEKCNYCPLSLVIKHKPNFHFATILAKVCINKIMLRDTID